MKKVLALTAFAAVATAASLSFAGLPSGTGVNGSLHDMNFYANAGAADGKTATGTGQQDVYNRVCVFCHTPHNADVIDFGYTKDDNNFLPLWGRATHGTVSESQTPYQWATPSNDGIDNKTDPLQGPSRLCMSCHDGSVAVDAHTSNGTQNGAINLSGSRAIGSGGSELMKTHPIGFDYIAAKDARNKPETTDLATGVTTVNSQYEIVDENEGFATKITASTTQEEGYNTVERKGARSIKSVLYKGSVMTCASCHEVHNKESVKQEAGPTGKIPNYFLYAKEKESLICLSCHVK